MTSEVDICNQALARIGASMLMAITDETREGQLCRAHYNSIRRVVLSEMQWTFATKRYVLSHLAGEYPANKNYYKFLVPSEVLNVLSVTDDGEDLHINTLDWTIEGKHIFAPATTIYMKATADYVDSNRYSPLFEQAFMLRLAAALANPMTANAALTQALLKEYGAVLRDASSRDGQQGRTERIRSKRYIISRLR